MARAAEQRAAPIGRWVLNQAGAHQPAHELAERDLRLGPGEWRAEAVVDASAEAQVLVVEALGVEAVWVRKALGVAASCGQTERDRRRRLSFSLLR
jgi:hypothetical protein